ncbi:hypothetical protein [uncultured Bacteroides sp.]|uniref:hypothetical protein n=1 Tax=uncultured Bacteroides sp. TaxID=162156 RepID=UPI002AAAFE74|nr:hypothetical protein [uncultured Bacteroides sp.]
MCRRELGRELCRKYQVDTLREAIASLMEEVDFITALADELEPLPPEGSAYVDERELEQERERLCLAQGLSRWG